MSRGKIVIEGIKDINLEHIFECGQIFRWTKESDGSYTVVAFDKVVNMSMEGSGLVVHNTDADEFKDVWAKFLDLDRDYSEIKKIISADDPIMERAVAEGYGIRILRQEPWEMLISFIISSNNNIPRIKSGIESLCNKFGHFIGSYKGKEYCSFPRPEELAVLKVEDLESCKLGYRSRYIINTARAVVDMGEDNYYALAEKPLADVLRILNDFSGVGPKVAHCIALFGMGKMETFPIDVWMKRVMAELYGIDEENINEMYRMGLDTFGEYAGIAQQYLFYYYRNKSGRENLAAAKTEKPKTRTSKSKKGDIAAINRENSRRKNEFRGGKTMPPYDNSGKKGDYSQDKSLADINNALSKKRPVGKITPKKK